jgi:hypothetical protein
MTPVSAPLQAAKSRMFLRPSTPRREPLKSLRYDARWWSRPCSLPPKKDRPRRAPLRFLTEPQVEVLRRAVKTTSRNPHGDTTLILVPTATACCRRPSTYGGSDVQLHRTELFVRRLKRPKSTMQPIEGEGDT